MKRSGHIFIGRHREMAVLQSALDDALIGHRRLVMMRGEPGIGKTRTAQNLVASAERSGAVGMVLRGHVTLLALGTTHPCLHPTQGY